MDPEKFEAVVAWQHEPMNAVADFVQISKKLCKTSFALQLLNVREQWY